MSDDTTTWLKKNPAINPLRRSLKTSLRFHVPSSDMNTSIMSNPDKVKDQGLFIPRMMQRTNMQIRKSRAPEFKVPELLVPKPAAKKEASGSGVKHKKVPTPNRTKKSLLPVPKIKGQSNGKVAVKSSVPRPSFMPGASGRRTAKQELIKKVVELSEIKRKELANSQLKVVSGDSSVLRSILKKRASLRRSSQISLKKPKAKKVLFDGFENSNSNSDGEKENEENPDDFNTALDEPTVFLNFPNGALLDESPFEPGKGPWTAEESEASEDDDVRHLMKLWESYKENLNSIHTERSSVEESLESLLEHSLSFQKEFQAYKEASGEMYSRLSRLGEEIEEKLRKVMTGGGVGRPEEGATPKSKRRSGGRRGSDRAEKIRLSDKSKVIKKNSGRKSVPLPKKDFLNDLEDDSFSIISRTSFLNK